MVDDDRYPGFLLIQSAPGIFEVHTASDGVCGLQMALQLRPDIVVAGCDVPGMDGKVCANSGDFRDAFCADCFPHARGEIIPDCGLQRGQMIISPNLAAPWIGEPAAGPAAAFQSFRQEQTPDPNPRCFIHFCV